MIVGCRFVSQPGALGGEWSIGVGHSRVCFMNAVGDDGGDD